MEWSPESPTEHQIVQDVAYEILQVYVQALQDLDTLKNLLSSEVVLDYFGDIYKGCESVANKIMTVLSDTDYEVSSVTVSNVVAADFLGNQTLHGIDMDSNDEELGVKMIASPKTIFQGLAFTTPPSSNTRAALKGKRDWQEASLDDLIGTMKRNKIQSTSKEDTTTRFQLPRDVKNLSASGTIRYPKRRTPTSDPKRAKHSSKSPRDRYCGLHLAFQLVASHPRALGTVSLNPCSCKIWAIKYHHSSRCKPRNLLQSFNEIDPD